MKKIVHYIAGPYLNTGENWIYTQLRYLEDCETTVYCHTTENLDQFPIENLRCLLRDESTRKPLDFLHKAWGRSFGLFPPFAFYLLKDRPDLVHAHYGPAGYDFLRLKAMFKFPMITTFYDHDATALPAQHPEWLERYRMLFQQGECFLVEGQNMVRKLVDLRCPEDKIRIHHLGVNVDDIGYVPRSYKKDEEIKVLISGRFTEKKGIPYAIEAFSRVQQRNPRLKMKLTIIGDAQNTPAMQKEKEKILSAIRAGDIRVDLLGYRPHSFLINELCRHHIFLLPSVTAEDGDIEGGAPVAIIEASASGMPVLSTWHCDIPEVIIDGESGFLVPERDVTSLAIKLEEMVLNPGQWLEMGKKGRMHIEKEFNSKKQAEILGEIYDTYISHDAGRKTLQVEGEVRAKRDSFLIFGSPLIDQPEIDEVVDSLKSGWLCSGYKVQRLENMFKEYKGVGFAAAVSSCTAALHLSMLAIGIEPGDEVIVPDMTFGATANAVIHAGGRPVLADCRRDTMNIDPAEIERRITPKTKAIIPVHFAGRACEMDAIMSFAESAGLAVIEDCAHAIETEYHGRKAGTFGEIGCFSFYVNKNIASGEGGMLITNNERYADKVKILALHGMTKDAWKRFSDEGYKHYQYVCCGYKYSMMDLQAAIAVHQLPRVDTYWERRREIWGAYMEAFRDLPVILPAPIEQDTRHAYHLFALLLKLEELDITRDQFLDRMTWMNIGVGVHYIALHLHPFYQQAFGYRNGDFPNAEWISERTVSIPLSPKLTDDDVEDVIEAVRAILLEGAK